MNATYYLKQNACKKYFLSSPVTAAFNEVIMKKKIQPQAIYRQLWIRNFGCICEVNDFARTSETLVANDYW